MLLRSGLSYSQATKNCSYKAQKAYDEAIAKGFSEEEADEIYRKTFDDEMKWYQS